MVDGYLYSHWMCGVMYAMRYQSAHTTVLQDECNLRITRLSIARLSTTRLSTARLRTTSSRSIQKTPFYLHLNSYMRKGTTTQAEHQ